jgi:hypothetical protein
MADEGRSDAIGDLEGLVDPPTIHAPRTADPSRRVEGVDSDR